MRFGVNWCREGRTHLEIKVLWRGFTHGYVLGFRLRHRRCGHMFIPRYGRWLWSPR